MPQNQLQNALLGARYHACAATRVTINWNWACAIQKGVQLTATTHSCVRSVHPSAVFDAASVLWQVALACKRTVRSVQQYSVRADRKRLDYWPQATTTSAERASRQPFSALPGTEQNTRVDA